MNLAIIYDEVDPFNGDLSVTNNQLDTVTGQEEIRQYSIQVLKTFFGEWFLDITIGIPYFDIFEKKADPDSIEALFVEAILSTLGIVRLLEFELTIPNKAKRELQLTYKAQTEESLEPLLVEETLP